MKALVEPESKKGGLYMTKKVYFIIITAILSGLIMCLAEDIPVTQVSEGDVICFGRYEQDNDASNGPEAIEWLVLGLDGPLATLISVKALECKPYNAQYAGVTWETCTLREWLNGTFLNTAFSAEEQAQLETFTVTADRNPRYSVSPGNHTRDKVCLLSIDEAGKYFPSDKKRACYATVYAKAQGSNTISDGACHWWLRTPGFDAISTACVRDSGSIDNDGCDCCDPGLSVRPVVVLQTTKNPGIQNAIRR